MCAPRPPSNRMNWRGPELCGALSPTRAERTEEIVRLVWEVEKEIDTVVALGVGTRCDENGDDNVIAPILERLGYKLERAKTNIGLGRITNQPAQQPARETVGVGK